MDIDYNASLEHALDLWVRWMRNDFGEVRELLWYPSESFCFDAGGWVRGENAFDELFSDSVERSIVVTVNKAVGDMPPAMRAALERSVGLSAVTKTRRYTELLTEAKGRVWRALLAAGSGV